MSFIDIESPKCLKGFEIKTSIDVKQWEDFVDSHEQGTIFQTPVMYDVYKNTKNYHPTKYFALKRSTGDLCGVLSSVVICEAPGLLSSFSKHCVIQGGPNISAGLEKIVMPLLLAEHDKYCGKLAIYCEIRNLFDVKSQLEGLKHYKFEDHLNFLLKLNQPKDDIWQQIHQSRRKNINKAQKQNLVVEEIRERKYLPIFYNLVKDTYKEAKIPVVHCSLFESAFDILNPKGMVKFFLAKHQDKYIGARAVLLYKSLIYDWYAGASKEALDYHPNDYLVWHILMWGMEHGYKTFDFGGAGKPDIEYGPREFKRRFGGELVCFGRNARIYHPAKMKLANAGFKLYQHLFF
jgi:serine/alanine adding enzyme